MIINFDMIENENEEQFTWRLCNAKSSGLIECSWKDVADTINSIFKNEDEYLNESAYRKPYQSARRYFESGVFNTGSNDDLNNSIVKLEKEKIKIRDARNDYKEIIRKQARRESLIEELEKIISDNTTPLSFMPNNFIKTDESETDYFTNKDMIIPLTDIHAGINICNIWNDFNTDVLVKRMNSYLGKILDIRKTHNCEDAYVVISEVISGYIHTDLIKETNLTMMQQLTLAVDIISEFLAYLSVHFRNVYVYCVAGNHSRVTPNKKESIKGNNLDLLVIPFLKAKLQNYSNIYAYENDIDEYIATFFVRDNYVVASHGDRDKIEDCVQKYTMLIGRKPDIVLLGHRHTNSVTTVYDSKVVQSGCISGTDSFAIDLRMRNKPEQLVTIVSHNGVECYYEVPLNNINL